ncbi:hypothetical protein [Hydrogenophaga sp.]
MDIGKAVQIALLGEVPATLRFVYAHLRDNTLHFRAVFADEATDDHLACATTACSEVLAHCDRDTQLDEIVVRDSAAPWKVGDGENLWFLRYGELGAT